MAGQLQNARENPRDERAALELKLKVVTVRQKTRITPGLSRRTLYYLDVFSISIL